MMFSPPVWPLAAVTKRAIAPSKETPKKTTDHFAGRVGLPQPTRLGCHPDSGTAPAAFLDIRNQPIHPNQMTIST
jgi:hypothetical protein